MSTAHQALAPLAHRPAAWGRGWLVVAGLLSLLFAPARAADEEDEDKTPPLPKDVADIARKYSGVTEWLGFFEFAASGSGSLSNPNFGIEASAQGEAGSHGRFTLKPNTDGAWDPRRGMFSWVVAGGAPGEASGIWHEQYSLVEGYSGQSEEWRSELAGTVPMLRTEFKIYLTKQFVSLHPGYSPDSTDPSWTVTGKRKSEVNSVNGQRRFATTAINETSRGAVPTWNLGVGEEASRRQWAVVREGPGVLTFSHEEKGRIGVFTSRVGPMNLEEGTRRSRVILSPVYDDLEVEVTIGGYAKWRPLGSIEKPTEPGNNLVARATLRSKTGKVSDLPAVKRFKFELLDTSREPGVCLNWPLGAKDQDYDLRLSAEGGGKLSDSDQKLSLTELAQNEKGQTYAEAKVDSYDFGGRATLQVVCELEDGREIMGLMKGEGGGEDLVRLPKMNGPGWIAEKWRKDNKAEKLADNDDNEKVEGQRDNGDGFTLYEEYRGWVENGKHLEGDPEGKDFFVLNMIGADGRPGIELFATLSKLRVHSKLRRWEMSQEDRLMNGNHRDAPHRAEGQHGVWVKTYSRSDLGDTGAATRMAKGGVAGRPGTTLRIGILARNNTESIFNQPFNLPPQDVIFAFDRAIAHELLHSVGVQHHGGDDSTLSVRWVSPSDPRNKLGRPHMQYAPFGGLATVLNESGHDVAAKGMESWAARRTVIERAFGDRLTIEARKYRDYHDNNGNSLFKSENEFREHLLEDMVGPQIYSAYNELLGEPNHAHSGNQDCLMRYYFARYYPAKNKADTYYEVTPGTERIGFDICHSAKGTGINAPKPPNLPQSRYGDATEGDCFSQICPNDAIPPKKEKW
jgi:hypothetical protein